MMRISRGHEAVDPVILNILKGSDIPLPTLGINYMVNKVLGKTITLNVVKNQLESLLDRKKVSRSIDENGVAYYKLIE